METVFVLCKVLAQLIQIYSFLVWLRLILSWFRFSAEQQNSLFNLLCSITDPFLRIFRREKFRTGALDWSPLFALMCLNILKSILIYVGEYQKFTLFLIIAVILENLWGYLFSYVFLILLIMLIVRLIVAAKNPQSVWLDVLDRNLNSPVRVVFRLFFTNKNPTDQRLVLVSFLFYGVIYLALKYGIIALCNFLRLL